MAVWLCEEQLWVGRPVLGDDNQEGGYTTILNRV